MLAMGVAVASCASNPGGAAAGPQVTDTRAEEPQSFTGFLELIVTDQYGEYVERATVDLQGTGTNFWRATGITSLQGSVTFSKVPPEVEVNIVSQYGAEPRRVLVVPQAGGTVEYRITITTYGADPQEQATDINNTGF
jgi:hypothetical protein